MKKLFNFRLLVLIGVLIMSVSQMWAETLHIRGYAGWDDCAANTMTGSASPWTFTAYWESAGEFKIHNGSNWLGSPASSGTYVLTFGTEVELTKDGGNNMKFSSVPTDGGRYKISVRKSGDKYYLTATKEVEEGSTGYDISSSPYIYFNVAAASSTYSVASILLGKSDGSQDYPMSSKLSGTQLFYKQMPNWSGFKTFLFIDANNWGGSWSYDKVTQRIGGATNTNSYNTGMSGGFHMFTAASGDDNAALSYTSETTYGALLNKTQTIEVYAKAPGGSYTKKTSSWPGTLTPDRYYMSSATATTHVNNTALTASSSVTVSAVLTSAFSLSQSTGTGYDFDGWGTSSSATPSGKNAAYTISSISGTNTICAFYTEKAYSIVFANDGHGTVEVADVEISSGSPANVNHFTTKKLEGIASAGYHFSSWSLSGTNTDKVTIADKTSTGATTTIKATATGATVTANFDPNTYTITLDGNGGSGHTSSVSSTYNSSTLSSSITNPTKTGYNFAGWYSGEGGTGTLVINTSGVLQSDVTISSTAWTDGSGNWVKDGGVTLYAKWTAKQSAISFDFQNEAEGYGADGSITNVNLKGTYGLAMTTLTGDMPTAAAGYAFIGFYDAASDGTKYYNADGTSARTWDKDTESGTTLYAYYQQAEITGITFSPGTVVENNTTVTVSVSFDPTPTPTTTVCWSVLYDNGSALDPQPEFDPEEAQGTSVSFTAPNASGMYTLKAVLHTGNGCSGEELSTYEADFQVAGSHTVTVAYKYSSTEIKASESVTGRPTTWSSAIEAPNIFGYTFDHWTAGDGITLSEDGEDDLGDDESTSATIYIKATYNGTLTANYTPKNIVYFKDNLGWTDPEDENAHIYVNLLQTDYWDTDLGSGNYERPNRNLEMNRVPGTTDIFYYEYGNKTTSRYISFTKESMGNSGNFYQAAPNMAHVVFPSRALDVLGTDNKDGLGFYAATPMFVPLATQAPVKKNSDRAAYYNDGYWTKYLPGTGYSLDIYESNGSTHVKTISFTSADELMPMKVVTDLEGGHTYKFQLKRDGDVYYGNNGTMTYNDHGQNTAWDFFNNSPFNMCTINTNAAGDYTFNLSYSPDNEGNHNRLRMSVDYPVADGDYRLVYTDNTRSYVVDAVTKYRIKPSAIVNKVNDGTDIVSFFVRKDENPKLYIQQATVNPSTGAITWSEYPNPAAQTNQITGTIASGITKDSVWNFNLSMDEDGDISVTSVEGYSGNYYIRTDAANSKWDNYRTDPDHLMTYSDYLKSDVGYTHYYTHWVRYTDTGRKNVKFVIANDYSPCISDTLERETASGTWANIATYMEEGGDLKRSANVRFMWDIKTNNIARAYVDGAQEDGSEYMLMLNTDYPNKIRWSESSALTDSKVTFSDNGNWIYEANIQAQPNAKIKLKSTWGSGGTAIVQYFKGSSSEDATLVGGSGSTWYDFRLIYDFKTNRLVTSYVPATGTITDNVSINADVMFIREHQGDIAQLTFSENAESGEMGSISAINTAYGVMRFNKWTINNKAIAKPHSPLSPELSSYERDLFYISFPFRVSLEEVFGFGTYGTHWIIEEYDGAGRAANGYWADSESYWKFITNRRGKFLEPNTGYILALDLDELGESSSVWANTEQVELYFPSYGEMPTITSSSVTYNIPTHTCNIGPRFEGGEDRRVKDSHWNVLSVPTYINTSNLTFASTDWITTADKTHVGPQFLYTWNMNDNTLTATNGVGYTYKAMHAYMVQYYGNVTWTTSVSPAASVAARLADTPDREFKLVLQSEERMEDQTFVRMTDDANVSAGFEFNYDLSKEMNKNRANIYTLISTTIDSVPSITEAAANVQPHPLTTTIVPVGVKIAANGEYTFSMPEGTNGGDVWLIDNVNSSRTNLGLMDYTVNLTTGTYEGRFSLEFPVQNVVTDIDNAANANANANADVRKVFVGGRLYILRDGKAYDATGAQVR